MHLSKEIFELHYCGLTYAWHEGAFLSRCQAQYALERLWVLVAGDAADWEDAPVLSIPAIDEAAVHTMFALQPGKLFWIPLQDVLPPGTNLHLDTDRLPALCQCYPKFDLHKPKSILISLDLVAATFLLLSRWEEQNIGIQKDKWGNSAEDILFPMRQGFLDRPVLDEWGAVLRAWIQSFYPKWAPFLPGFRIQPTHDIDHLTRYPRPTVIPRRIIGTALRTRCLKRTTDVAKEGIAAIKDPSSDPGVRIINDLAFRNKSMGLSGIFFFMSATPGKFDEGYNIIDKFAMRIIKDLTNMDQIIGWHPGFHAAEDRQRFITEKLRIEAIWPQAKLTTRLHYLRWRKHTLSWLKTIDSKNDHSWGMNDHVGFAHGTSHPFPLWDTIEDKPTMILETPLIVQDGAFVREVEKDYHQAMLLLNTLINRTKRVSGCFSFLIHNNPDLGSHDYSDIADLIYNALL